MLNGTESSGKRIYSQLFYFNAILISNYLQYKTNKKPTNKYAFGLSYSQLFTHAHAHTTLAYRFAAAVLCLWWMEACNLRLILSHWCYCLVLLVFVVALFCFCLPCIIRTKGVHCIIFRLRSNALLFCVLIRCRPKFVHKFIFHDTS